MYETAFGFHRHPFQAFDPRRPYYKSDCVQKLLPQFLHALRTDLGVAVLTGPPGIGKSAFLRHLRSVLSAESRILLCSAAAMDSSGALWELLSAAPAVPRNAAVTPGSSALPPASLSGSRWNVVERLQKSAELWGPLLLFIDDAHLLSPAVLHELRALLEESCTSGQLVRGLIAGPLSLEEEFARPSHSDFSGMIRCHGFLQPLTSPESVQYLSALIRNVGRELSEVFDAEALEFLVQAADGNPRMINLLSDESFLVAFETGSDPDAQASRHLKIQAGFVRTALNRLRHLPYSWNAPASLLDTERNAAPAVDRTFQTGTVFGTDAQLGIVEIGSSLSDDMSTGWSSRVESASESGSGQALIASGITSSADNEYGIETEIETDDLLSVEEFLPDPGLDADAEFNEDTFCESELYSELEVAGTLTKDTGLAEAGADIEAGTVVDTGTDLSDVVLPDSDWPAIHDVPERTQGEGFMVPSSPAVAIEFEHLEGSNRLPVFDRYTWIELNREVPPGDQSMQTIRRRGVAGAELTSTVPRFLPLTADHVPIFTVTEENFDVWLNEQPVPPAIAVPAVEPTAAVDATEPEGEEQFFFSLPIPIDQLGGSSGTGNVRKPSQGSAEKPLQVARTEDVIRTSPAVPAQDDVLPLAKSVASLHEEVHSFHAGFSAASASGTQIAQPYVVGSLLREALSRAEPESEPMLLESEKAEEQSREAVSESSRPARFANLFSSLRSLRRIDNT